MKHMQYLLVVIALLVANVGKAEMYFAVDYGSSELDSYLGFEDDDSAFKVAIGSSSENFGFEGYYVDFGSPGFSIYTDEITGFGFDARFQSSGDFQLFGSLGLLLWDLDEKIAGTTFYSDSGVGFKFGLGASYRFTESLAIRVSYDKYMIEDEFDDQHDQTMTSAGLVVFF